MARRLGRLIWTEPALNELDDISAWIADEDRLAASRLVQAVLDATARLKRRPRMGRAVPEAVGKTHREVIVRPLRIVYRLAGKDVLVVAVLRGEQPLRATHLR